MHSNKVERKKPSYVEKFLKSSFLSLYYCLKQIIFFGSFDELKMHHLC